MSQPKIDFDDSARDAVCEVCNSGFRTMIVKTHTLSAICMICRNNWGVQTDATAKELLEQLDSMSVSDREALANSKQRQDPGHTSVHSITDRRMIGMGAGMGAHAPAPAPVINQTKVLAAVREMIDYGLTLPLATPLTKATNYVIAKNGLFEIRHTDIVDIVIQPKTVAGVNDELKEGVRMNLPLLPFSILSSIVAFFRAACKDYHGSVEAYVQVWWNTVDKTYSMHVPVQRVSGGSVHHDGAFDKDLEVTADGTAKWIHVGDIHSHGSSMSAFFSGVDDADERKFPEGRICGVIGKVNDSIPEWKWRVRVRDGFVALSPDAIFALPDEAMPFHVKLKDAFATSADAASRDNTGRIRLWCPVDPFETATFPPAWLEQLKGSGYSTRPHGGSGMTWAGGHGSSNPGYSTLPSYIYIKTKDGLHLEEFRVDISDSPVSTGRMVKLIPTELRH